MSRHNVKVPIFGLTTQLVSQRKMTLYRNVRPLLMPGYTDRDQALAAAEKLLVERGVLRPATPTPSPAASRWAIRAAPTCSRSAASPDDCDALTLADVQAAASACAARWSTRPACIRARCRRSPAARWRSSSRTTSSPPVLGARRAQQDGAAAERGRTRGRRARRLGRQPRAGRGLPRAAHGRAGHHRDAALRAGGEGGEHAPLRRHRGARGRHLRRRARPRPRARRGTRPHRRAPYDDLAVAAARARSRFEMLARSRSSTRWWSPSAAAG